MPGPHDFAVRSDLSQTLRPAMCALSKFRRRALKRRSSARRPFRSRETRPATPCAPDAAASTASNPASVTIAIRPSFGIGWRELVAVICPTGKGEYF